MNGLLTQTSLLQKAVLSMAFMVLKFPIGGEMKTPGEIYLATTSS